MSKKCYNSAFNKVHAASKEVSEESMLKAAEEKRCGTPLRRLKIENKTLKLKDRKGLGGAGRLTDKKIDTLQKYYGFAIWQNAGNLDNMVKGVQTVLPHVASSEQNKMHDNCPNGPQSWCKFKADPKNYKHKNGLPPAIVDFIKPVFEDLADKMLLGKCLHGKIQNNNECLNKLIWERCFKEKYVEKLVIEQAVYSAIAYFNEGATFVSKLFEKLGISPGTFTKRACEQKDNNRLYHSARKSLDSSKRKGEKP
ncbi:forkhead box protein k1 [Plakobranchus ocellatus]|uniref:Forkhead box protein k1 n=1 Tax=Plakobranchus ocellatus TaxID=259542 RepID=A0AAV3YH39_9GAST|nr:forkhead box protein k1 [Plakobranchus ocellatus]